MLTGCSVYKVASQAPPADLAGIGVGTTRHEIITRLGSPKLVDTTANGNKQDVFEFQSGFHPASKLRILPYLAADVFTLSLAELILWPIELTFMDSATCTAIVTYDSALKATNWSVSRKQDASAQGC
jgi:outer membrane protein assembly factor BamE (lipoprotein component of BamABCDE complex)